MAKPDRTRNTNVPSTIAGFYFQIVLACCEICKDSIMEVGVETDADVVTVDRAGEKAHIESKLHAKKFGKFSDDVIKTIYNFYNCYAKSAGVNKMYFVTNVGIQSKDEAFFKGWGNKKTCSMQEEYVMEAVLRESIILHDECKENYKQFCSIMKKFIPRKNDDYKNELIQEVFSEQSSYSYEDFAVVNDDCPYSEFISKMHFVFLDREKKDLLEGIEKKTKEKIKSDYRMLKENEEHQELEEQEADGIFCMMVKLFFDCIAENSQKKTKRMVSAAEYQI